MNQPSPYGTREPARPGAGQATGGEAGVIGIALAAVLTAALAQGSWQWFATYVGLTLLAVVCSFYALPAWTPGLRTAYVRKLVAFALTVGLCIAITLAPMLQRWAWLFPMEGTRSGCGELGRYESLRAEAELAQLTGRDRPALARAQQARSHVAVADCLSATTTLWLPLYGAGAAVLVGAGAWTYSRARARKESGSAASR
ncbi:hypothetical protein [Streptomyces platensis]|uniref:hypothetical protein n=1 Tax=Streptomyces platensis TaxID=58346 RepID=UPI002E8175BF|nr:hypothetical protein [Streptomyces platensis]WUB79724.1 hypothetical protein OG424_11355 [Streptomyces platensis]